MPFFYLSPKIHGYSVWETLLPLLPYLHLVPQRKLLFKKFKLQTGIFEHMSDVTYRLWYKLKRRIYILYDACICIKSFGKYYHKSLSYVLLIAENISYKWMYIYISCKVWIHADNSNTKFIHIVCCRYLTSSCYCL